MHATLYHSTLRVSALVLTGTLLFVSGSLHPVTKQLTVETENYVAASISASAGVAPTELNQVTAALTEQQAALDERERALSERELELGLRTANNSVLQSDLTTWLNSLLLFLVLVLLVINYSLDFAHRRRVAA